MATGAYEWAEWLAGALAELADAVLSGEEWKARELAEGSRCMVNEYDEEAEF